MASARLLKRRRSHDLAPFLEAQDAVWADVTAELRAGRKASHWIWFVFPQLRGLGRSPQAEHYGIVSVEEARAYLAHPVLGARLRQACGLLLGTAGRDAVAILGGIDAVKVRSSMTLFLRADPTVPCFQAVLDRFYDGRPDPETDRLLG